MTQQLGHQLLPSLDDWIVVPHTYKLLDIDSSNHLSVPFFSFNLTSGSPLVNSCKISMNRSHAHESKWRLSPPPSLSHTHTHTHTHTQTHTLYSWRNFVAQNTKSSYKYVCELYIRRLCNCGGNKSSWKESRAVSQPESNINKELQCTPKGCTTTTTDITKQWLEWIMRTKSFTSDNHLPVATL